MKPEIIVIAHNLRSSHNAGSVLRTCDGIGVQRLFFTGYSPYPLEKEEIRLPHIAKRVDRQIDKTALGAQNSQAWRQVSDLDEVLKKLSNEGYSLCALEQSAHSISLERFSVPDKVALLIGNEVDGLDTDTLKKVDYIVEIPMFGKKESFNVAQAAAMALYAFRFPRV